jgi:hypothetical protein
VHSWNIFGVRMSHGQLQTHKTHHVPNLGEATTFPLIVYSVPLHGGQIQMVFCPEIPIATTPPTLGHITLRADLRLQ